MNLKRRLKMKLLAVSLMTLMMNTALANITGYVDKVSNGVAYGWACDSGVRKSINIHLYAAQSSGKKSMIAGAKANLKSEGAIAKRCGTKGVHHRFAFKFSSTHMKKFGGQKLFVYGISLSKGKNHALTKSGQFIIPHAALKNKSLIKDHPFKAGFNFKNTTIPAKAKSAGKTSVKIPRYLVSLNDFAKDPIWNVSEWFSNNKVSTKGRKSGDEYVWANGSKALKAHLKTNMLTFSINTNNDYKGKYRKASDPWAHLLIEQSISNPYNVKDQTATIAQMQKLQLKIKTRLAYEKEIIKKGHNKSIHAQQFLLYFTVQNLNRKSKGFGQYIWIGVPFHDNRHKFSKGSIHIDKGTNSLIYNMDFNDLSKTSLQSKQWVNIDYDMLPHIRKALNYAFSKNILKSKSMNDYRIGGMNMGFETTGLFITTVQVKDFQLIQSTY